MNLSAQAQDATPSGRVATWGRRKVKLWEEPDQKLVTDDARDGCHSFWAEWQNAVARTPVGTFQNAPPVIPHEFNPSKSEAN